MKKQRKRGIRRVLTLLLCLAMVLNSSGVTVLAQGAGKGYTVEFSKDSLEYVLPGDSSVAMSEILQALGLSGEVTAVEISNTDLFSASNETGEWIVSAHQEFTSTEWMKVTIGDEIHEIVVTDDPDDGTGDDGTGDDGTGDDGTGDDGTGSGSGEEAGDQGEGGEEGSGGEGEEPQSCGHQWNPQTGICEICNEACTHEFENDHDFSDGISCDYCGFTFQEGETAFSLGENNVSLGTYRRFTPEKSGTYAFYSVSEFDTKGDLFDDMGVRLRYNDDIATGINNNFGIRYPLTAGVTYTLLVRQYNENDFGNDVTVCVQRDVDYYIVGTFNDWKIDEKYQMNVTDDFGEYSLENVPLKTEDQFKIAAAVDGEEVTTVEPYPNGTNNAYGANGEIENDGIYRVAFRPGCDGGDEWFHNCLSVTYNNMNIFPEEGSLVADYYYLHEDYTIDGDLELDFEDYCETIQLFIPENVTLTIKGKILNDDEYVGTFMIQGKGKLECKGIDVDCTVSVGTQCSDDDTIMLCVTEDFATTEDVYVYTGTVTVGGDMSYGDDMSIDGGSVEVTGSLRTTDEGKLNLAGGTCQAGDYNEDPGEWCILISDGLTYGIASRGIYYHECIDFSERETLMKQKLEPVKGTEVGTWDELLEALGESGSVILEDDIYAASGDENLVIPVGKTVGLILNGFKIDGTALDSDTYPSVLEVCGELLLVGDDGDITGEDGVAIVHVQKEGVFTMTGGSIHGKNVSKGLVYNENQFFAKGGVVTHADLKDDEKKPIGVCGDGVLTISGSPKLDLVSLPENCVIEIGGELTNGCWISILNGAEGPITHNWSKYMDGEYPAEYFGSVEGAYGVRLGNSGEAEFAVPLEDRAALKTGVNVVTLGNTHVFTLSEGGVYCFRSVGNGDTVGTLKTPDGLTMVQEDDYGSDHNFRIYAYLLADQAYTLDICAYSKEENGVAYGVIVEAASFPELELGKNKLDCMDGDMYAFTAPTAGKYVFCSEGDHDTCGTLIGGFGMIAANDDGGEDANFYFSTILSAGQTVLLKMRVYDGGDEEPVQIPVYVKKGTMTQWDELQSALSAGGEVVLESDYVAGIEDSALFVPRGTQVELDLNGHTIDGSVISRARGDVLVVYGDLTLEDSMTSGIIKGQRGDHVIFAEDAKLAMKNIHVQGASSENYAVCLNGCNLSIQGKMTIEGGVSLDEGYKIVITSRLTGESPILVAPKTSGVFTSGWNRYMREFEPNQFFTGAGDYAIVVNGSNELAAEEAIPYMDADGVEQICETYTIIDGSENEFTSGGWFYVKDDVSLEYIHFADTDEAVHLILGDYGCLNVENEIYFANNITVYGQQAGTGSINVGSRENPSKRNCAVCVFGSLAIHGGNLSIWNVSEEEDPDYAMYLYYGVDITGGCLEVNARTGLSLSNLQSGGNLNVSGGAVDVTATEGRAIEANNATINVTGGTLLVKQTEAAKQGGTPAVSCSGITLDWTSPDWDNPGSEIIRLDGVACSVDLKKSYAEYTYEEEGAADPVCFPAGQYDAEKFNASVAGKELVPYAADGELHGITCVLDGGDSSECYVEASASVALKGQVINIYAYVTDDSKYEFSSIKVMCGDTEVPVEDDQFTMPDGDVTVTATFASAPTYALSACACDVENTDYSIGDILIIAPEEDVYYRNDRIMLEAPDKGGEGYQFFGWFEKDGQNYEAENAIATTLRYEFQIKKDMDLVAVYGSKGEAKVTISCENAGAGFYLDDQQEISNFAEETVRLGTELTIYAEHPEQVLYWRNASGRVLGTDERLTITVTSNMTIELVYHADEEGQAYLQYVSGNGQLLSSTFITSETQESDVEIPAVPSKFGYTFIKWVIDGTNEDATFENILAMISPENPVITVKPTYKKDNKPCSVTVAYVDAAGNPITDPTVYGDLIVGDSYTATAPEFVGGGKFVCWKSGETILSYDRRYFMKLTGNVTLAACYDDGDDEVEVKPVITIGRPFKTVTGTEPNEVHKITAVITRDVPSGYTLLEQGVLYARGADALDEDTLVVANTDVTKYQSPDTSMKGTLTANIKTVGEGWESIVVSFRGYMIVKEDETGTEKVYYTEVAAASYNSLTE